MEAATEIAIATRNISADGRLRLAPFSRCWGRQFKSAVQRTGQIANAAGSANKRLCSERLDRCPKTTENSGSPEMGTDIGTGGQ